MLVDEQRPIRTRIIPVSTTSVPSTPATTSSSVVTPRHLEDGGLFLGDIEERKGQGSREEKSKSVSYSNLRRAKRMKKKETEQREKEVSENQPHIHNE